MRNKPLLFIFNNWFEIIFSILWIDGVFCFGLVNYSYFFCSWHTYVVGRNGIN
jgi:hypothetical protein